MLFATLLAIEPKRNREVYAALRAFKPARNVKVRTKLGLFGEYDALVVYEARDEETGMNFLLSLCKIDGVSDTRTFAAITL